MAIVISLIALVVSITTLYYTSLQQANLNIRIGNSYGLATVEMGNTLLPSIALPITIVNEGAKSGEVYQLALEVIYPSGKSDYFKSIRVVKSLDTIVNNNQEKIQANVEDIFFSISLLGKSKSQNIIVFIPINEKSFNFPDDFKEAVIILHAIESERNEWKIHDKSDIKVDIGFSYKNKDQRIRETGNAIQNYKKLNNRN
ncbi:MAG: hypothetical protein KAQ87_03075 [Candidatus Pacebacteria bacterium]|nr:hypothetical protein [Candidatus Paceibacterota bacterium]